MAVHSIIPNTNVSFNDIRDTLNANGGSVTNDFVTAFQERANINKWSKHKPIDYISNFCQDFDAEKPNYDPTWWRGNKGTCGINIPGHTNAESLISQYTGSSNWSYIRPSGGSASPYRLGDFCGYMTNAKSPVLSFVGPSQGEQNVEDYRFKITYNSDAPVGNLKMSDFQLSANGTSLNFLDCYAGILLVRNTDSYVYSFVNANKTNLRADDINMSLKNVPTGGYKIYPFLAKTQFSGGSIGSNNTIFTLPVSPVAFTVNAQAGGLSFIITEFTVSSVSGKLNFNLTILFTNRNVAQVSITDLYMTVEGDGMFSVYEGPLDGISIPGNQQITKQYTVQTISRGYDTYLLTVKSNRYAITASAIY